MSQEDAIAQRIITELSGEDVEFHTEVHYNHFGDRGVVDLLRIDKLISSFWGYEIKSVSATENATGANEIIRQFNRHRKYFFKGSEWENGGFDDIHWIIVFPEKNEIYQHLHENEILYRNLVSAEGVAIRFIDHIGFLYDPFTVGEIRRWRRDLGLPAKTGKSEGMYHG